MREVLELQRGPEKEYEGWAKHSQTSKAWECNAFCRGEREQYPQSQKAKITNRPTLTYPLSPSFQLPNLTPLHACSVLVYMPNSHTTTIIT